jgi:hypothetical protein
MNVGFGTGTPAAINGFSINVANAAAITNLTADWDGTQGHALVFGDGPAGRVVWTDYSGPEGTVGLFAGDTAVFTFDTPSLPVVETSAYGDWCVTMYSYMATVASPGVMPSVGLNFDGQAAADKGTAKKIHINDNFDEGQETATALVSDFDKDPATQKYQIKDGDADLANAVLTINSPNKGWTLEWTVDPGVKVWYKEWLGENAGKWFEVSNRGYPNTLPPAQIELRVEGIDIKAGSVKAKFTAGVAGNPVVTDTIKFDVYTGLKVTGLLSGKFRAQIQQTTAYTVTSDSVGNVWRTGRPRAARGGRSTPGAT